MQARGRALDVARERLDAALLDPDVWRGIVSAVEAAVPGRGAALYDWADDGSVGRLMLSFPASARWTANLRRRLPMFRPYQHRSRATDSAAGRPVSLETVLRTPELSTAFRETVFKDIGIHDYVRATIWDRGRFVAWVGTFHERSTQVDTEAPTALRTLLPRIRAVVEVEQALRGRHREALCVVDALPTPAFLLRSDGRVVHMNALARRLWTSAPGWAQVKHPTLIPLERAHVVPLGLKGLAVWLVLPVREGRIEASPVASVNRISDVAHGLARGLSDKEIAVATARPLATVRKYVERSDRSAEPG